MFVIKYIALFIACLLFLYAAFPLVSMWLAGMNLEPRSNKNKLPKADFACIITAYGDAGIAVEQVYSLLAQNYDQFQVYVVADNYTSRPSFPEHESVVVLYPEKPLHAKLKSIQFAIDAFVRPHNTILILDADNLLHPNALSNFNQLVKSGYTAIQGQRTAKNLDTPVAALDALGELYYNVSQRWAPFKLGSSATIAGSGMAIEASFFKRYVQTLLAGEDKLILAEDKMLQMMLVEQGHRIAYCRNALIFDEKVKEGAQVQRQRTRWLRSWFDHWTHALQLAFKGLLKGNWNQLFFGVMLCFPPMVLLVAGLLFTSFIGLLIYMPVLWISLTGLGVFILGFIWALAVAPAPAAVWKAIPYIPVFVVRQVLALLKIKESSKDFMATTHTQYLSLQQVWEQRKNDFPYLKNQS